MDINLKYYVKINTWGWCHFCINSLVNSVCRHTNYLFSKRKFRDAPPTTSYFWAVALWSSIHFLISVLFVYSVSSCLEFKHSNGSLVVSFEVVRDASSVISLWFPVINITSKAGLAIFVLFATSSDLKCVVGKGASGSGP